MSILAGVKRAIATYYEYTGRVLEEIVLDGDDFMELCQEAGVEWVPDYLEVDEVIVRNADNCEGDLLSPTEFVVWMSGFLSAQGNRPMTKSQMNLVAVKLMSAGGELPLDGGGAEPEPFEEREASLPDLEVPR